MSALGLSLALVIGVSLGMLGGGGSILTVPVMVYVLGFTTRAAVASSLAVVGAASLVGSVGHWREGNVRLKTALLFGAFAMVGAFGGARLGTLLAGPVQLVIFAGVMIAAAVSMYRRAVKGRGAGAEEEGPRALPLGKTAAVGIGVGVLTGLVGVGGGFLIVPALVLLARLPMKQAVGTSLLVIAMNAAAGLAGYLGAVALPWGYLAVFTAVVVGGILLGTWAVRFVRADSLQKAFALFLVVMGVFILYQNRGVLVG